MKSILIIDDEFDLAESMASVLASEGYSTKAFASGKEALDLMKEQKPDLVITDYMMPDLSGRDVIRLMKDSSDLKNIPIMLMSASKAPKLEDHIRCDYFLSKPFDLDHLFKEIENLL